MMGGTGLPFSATTWRAQVFTAGVTGELLSASFFPFWVGPFGSLPSLTLSVRAASGGMPTGPDLAVQTVPPWAGNWVDVSFATPPTLLQGNEYALVVRAVTNPSEGTYSWGSTRPTPTTAARRRSPPTAAPHGRRPPATPPMTIGTSSSAR